VLFDDQFDPESLEFQDGSQGCEFCFENCEKRLATPWKDADTGERHTRCPFSDIHPESLTWMTVFSHYQDGFLYRDGAIADQPAVYCDAMRMLSQKKQEHQKRQLEEDAN